MSIKASDLDPRTVADYVLMKHAALQPFLDKGKAITEAEREQAQDLLIEIAILAPVLARHVKEGA